MNLHTLQTEWLTTQDVLLLPKQGVVSSRSEINVVPFMYSAPMDTVTGYELVKVMLEKDQYPVLSRFCPLAERLKTYEEFSTYTHLFFAIGLDDDKFLSKLCEDRVGRANVAIDVAHGDMKKVHELTKRLAFEPSIRYIMSGSICTEDAAYRAIEAGCTHLRVGVGPGAACTTRIQTGVGAPNLSAVYRIRSLVDKEFPSSGIQVIADGGIKAPGDAVKYLAAGAHGVMMGQQLSTTKESAGWVTNDSGRTHKTYRGQASAEFQQDQFGKINACPEGASTKEFYWQGETFADVLNRYTAGIQSACSYLGVKWSHKLRDNATFIKITHSGYIEGTPHGT